MKDVDIALKQVKDNYDKTVDDIKRYDDIYNQVQFGEFVESYGTILKKTHDERFLNIDNKYHCTHIGLPYKKRNGKLIRTKSNEVVGIYHWGSKKVDMTKWSEVEEDIL